MDWNAPLIQDADSIRAIVPIPAADQSDVRFFLEIGRAIVVAPTFDRKLTEEELRSINKKSNWDVYVYSQSEFDQVKSQARDKFSQIPNVNEQLTNFLIDNAYFDFDDLSVIDPEWLTQHVNIDSETVDAIIESADIEALRLERDGG